MSIPSGLYVVRVPTGFTAPVDTGWGRTTRDPSTWIPSCMSRDTCRSQFWEMRARSDIEASLNVDAIPHRHSPNESGRYTHKKGRRLARSRRSCDVRKLHLEGVSAWFSSHNTALGHFGSPVLWPPNPSQIFQHAMQNCKHESHCAYEELPAP